MKIIQFFLSLIFLVIIGGILILGYLGFIPILSDVMGVGKPKDLGVKYSQKEYQTFADKTNGDVIEIKKDVPPNQSIVYEGKKDIKDSFSQEELSGRLNYAKWKYMPVGNTQIRINDDGTVEFSANVLMSRLPGFIAREGMGQYTIEDVTKGLEFINMIKVNPPVYTKFTANVVDNKLSLNIQKIEVGKFNVPLGKIGANQVAAAVFNNIISKAPGFYGKSVTFSHGQMIFEGSIPAKETVEVVQ